VFTCNDRPASPTKRAIRSAMSNEPRNPRNASCDSASGPSMLTATRRTPAFFTWRSLSTVTSRVVVGVSDVRNPFSDA
jgi:hypothetical protein